MLDLRLVWDPRNGRADIQLASGQPDISRVLETWVIVSLFTDRRAEPSDLPPWANNDPRGWWGDTYLALDKPGDRIGSRLWLLERAKSDAKLPGRARAYILEALQWMVDDRIAGAVDAVCTFPNGDRSRLDTVVTISRPDRTRLSFRFDSLWQELTLAA